MADAAPKVAVVIPAHDGLELTRRCLSALEAQRPAEFETVLVDDGSTDGTTDYVRTRHPDVTVLRRDGTLWWSGAVNAGCRHAIAHGADVVVLFNNDNVDCSVDVISRLARVAYATGAGSWPLRSSKGQAATGPSSTRGAAWTGAAAASSCARPGSPSRPTNGSRSATGSPEPRWPFVPMSSMPSAARTTVGSRSTAATSTSRSERAGPAAAVSSSATPGC